MYLHMIVAAQSYIGNYVYPHCASPSIVQLYTHLTTTS